MHKTSDEIHTVENANFHSEFLECWFLFLKYMKGNETIKQKIPMKYK